MPARDATTSLKYHGKQDPAVIRMPAQVPRGNIYQDGEIGGARDTPAPSYPWDERAEEDRTGWVDQLEETGDCSGTERTKPFTGSPLSPRRLNPFQLIPDRRELTVATTIVFSKSVPNGGVAV